MKGDWGLFALSLSQSAVVASLVTSCQHPLGSDLSFTFWNRDGMYCILDMNSRIWGRGNIFFVKKQLVKWHVSNEYQAFLKVILKPSSWIQTAFN